MEGEGVEKKQKKKVLYIYVCICTQQKIENIYILFSSEEELSTIESRCK